MRGEILCSSILQSGNVLVREHRDGAPLDRVWSTLSEIERGQVQAQCLNGIHALRTVGVRLDDAGKHNILYHRESRLLTLLDFEGAQEVDSNQPIPINHEMGAIFDDALLLGHAFGG